jgi:FMN phosphatase YigB (HAD superfamily)
MSATKPLAGKKNLLLCLDAFGTLFTPSTPIPIAYAQAAARHGINVGNTKDPKEVGSSFKSAFKKASQENPNYGKANNMGAEKWWANVIEDTFRPFLTPDQCVPPALTQELLRRYSSKKGYELYKDVRGFFNMLRGARPDSPSGIWPWNRTVVGIITNSDDRVPGILSSLGVIVSPRRYGVEAREEVGTRVKKKDVDFTVLSYDVGFEKPDRRIFAAAEELLASTLDDTNSSSTTPASSFEKLYVGDDIAKDIYGAEDAGWSSVLLTRDGIDNQGYGLKVSEEDVEGRGKRTVTKLGNLSDLCAWRPREHPEASPVRYVQVR